MNEQSLNAHNFISLFARFQLEGTVSGNAMLEMQCWRCNAGDIFYRTVLPEEDPLVVLQNLFYLAFNSHTSTRFISGGDYLYLSLTCLAV